MAICGRALGFEPKKELVDPKPLVLST